MLNSIRSLMAMFAGMMRWDRAPDYIHVDIEHHKDICRWMHVAIHDAIATDSFEPLHRLYDSLDIGCDGPECENASHPSNPWLCMPCFDLSQHCEDEPMEYDHRYDQKLRGQRC